MGWDAVCVTEWRRAVRDEREEALERQRQSRNEKPSQTDEKSEKESNGSSAEYWDSKIQKYRGLSNPRLIEKERKQKSKSTRNSVAAGTAGVTAIGTGLASTIVSGATMTHKMGKGDKSKTKEELLENERRSRGLQPKNRTRSDYFKDVALGVVEGGLGPEAAGAALDKLTFFS